MEKAVIISVAGRQRAVGGEEWEKSRTLAEGICQETEEGYAVFYEEQTNAGTVRTELRLSDGQIQILRRGGICLSLHLEPGQMREAPYTTPYGMIPLSVLAADVSTEFASGKISARAAYTLFGGGEPVSENELLVQIAPAE